MATKLDYTIKDPQERTALVQKIIEQTPEESLTPHYLEIMADYIIFAMDKEEKKKKNITTDNRQITISKRETSFEGLCSKLDNGEDGLYHMVSRLGKNTILTPKDPITALDVEEAPELQALREAIERVEAQYKTASGKRKYALKRQIIEMRQEQYLIRNSKRGPGVVVKPSSTALTASRMNLADDIYLNPEGYPVNRGVISFFNPRHIEALLCNYSGLKESSDGNFEYDLYYLMQDLDDLIESTLRLGYPLYYDLLIYKIDGRTNAEIQQLLYDAHGIRYSIEYISSLWRNKIPKLLADKATQDYLNWYYTEKERGEWKKCSKCGEIKLAHTKFFSRNNTSRDGWYSMCKACRSEASRNNRKKKRKDKSY